MALINCPECGTEVSDRAEKCPKCAYPINKEQIEPKIIVKNKEGFFLQSLNNGCIVVLLIIAAFIIVGIISSILGR